MSAGFQCKQFFVAHDQCAMKVGTDALILGAWASLPATGPILDIGAGSGILSLMLAQRSLGLQAITAIELDSAAAQQATANVQRSPWPATVRVIKGDILTYQTAERYALIVSNPPFFQASLPSPDAARQQARHNDSLPFAALLHKAADLLAEGGEFSLILPPDSATVFCQLALNSGLQLQRSTSVYAQPGKPLRRLLLSFRRAMAQPDGATVANYTLPDDELMIQQDRGSYSEQYRQLLKDFYLKF